MSIQKAAIHEFLFDAPNRPLLDVRSPSEFNHAHIPGAVNLPLFSDDERTVVGTAYKQQSREAAIKIGLNYFGKDLVTLLESAEKITNGKSELRLHCWRGGMRSAAVAWLLDLYGFKVTLLQGGYKAYRQWVLQQLNKHYSLKILSGYTGSNKTGLLQLLQATHAVIDIEQIARHKGSAFGNLDLIPQPSQEFFENQLAHELHRCEKQYPNTPIWLEAESQRLGSINIPLAFFTRMRQSPMLFMDVPFEARLKFVMEVYGFYSKEKLMNAIVRITKKLGGLETKTAVNHLLENNIAACFTILLKYYDKLYKKTNDSSAIKDRSITIISVSTTSALENQKLFLNHEQSNN